MNVNRMIKRAIRDPQFRGKLIADPVAICKEMGINGAFLVEAGFQARPITDPSIMQGGYRP